MNFDLLKPIEWKLSKSNQYKSVMYMAQQIYADPEAVEKHLNRNLEYDGGMFNGKYYHKKTAIHSYEGFDQIKKWFRGIGTGGMDEYFIDQTEFHTLEFDSSGFNKSSTGWFNPAYSTGYVGLVVLSKGTGHAFNLYAKNDLMIPLASDLEHQCFYDSDGIPWKPKEDWVPVIKLDCSYNRLFYFDAYKFAFGPVFLGDWHKNNTLKYQLFRFNRAYEPEL